MADIVNSLFGLPSEDVRQQLYQQQQDFSTQYANTYGNEYDKRNALLGGMVGNAVANLGAGIFGVQDPRLKRATTLESILQSTQQELGENVNNPAVLYPALQQRLAEAGFSREAMQVGQVGQKAMQESLVNKANLAAKEAELIKANKDKTYLAVGKNVFNVTTGKFEPAPAGTNAESTDIILSEAIVTLNNPNATAEEKKIAQGIYDKILPMKQPAQLTQPTPIQVTDNKGNVTLINPVTKEKTPLGTIGKPSGAFEKLQGAKKKAAIDTTFAIDTLKSILKEGTLETATGSGLGAIRDASVGFFGGSTEGSRAIGKLQPAYDIILKQVPRFEGPQSEKDVASYKEAAGNLASPNTPADVKIAAAKEILRIMEARQGQFIDKADEGSEGDPLYVQENAPTPVAKKEVKVPNQEYKRYIERWKQLSNDKAGQAKLTAAARAAGIVK